MQTVADVKSFPKLYAPFTRETNENGDYVVTPDVNDGYEWVFNDADIVLAVEKLDGENLNVTFNDNMKPSSIHRRHGTRTHDSADGYIMEEVPLWDESLSHYTEGIANAYGRGWIDYIDKPGQYFGELVGPKVQGNRYDLDKHYWVPFEYARKELVYESYGQYPTDYETIRDWFLDIELPPLFYHKMHGGMSFDKAKQETTVEGIVFTLPLGYTNKGPHMAKLRRDMFPEVADHHSQ